MDLRSQVMQHGKLAVWVALATEPGCTVYACRPICMIWPQPVVRLSVCRLGRLLGCLTWCTPRAGSTALAACHACRTWVGAVRPSTSCVVHCLLPDLLKPCCCARRVSQQLTQLQCTAAGVTPPACSLHASYSAITLQCTSRQAYRRWRGLTWTPWSPRLAAQ